MESWRENLILHGRASVCLVLVATGVFLLFAGCDSGAESGFIPPSPSPVIPPVATPTTGRPTVREIAVGDSVEGQYTYCFPCTNNDDELDFVFTAPSDGTVVVTLTWDPWLVGTIFDLTLDGVRVLGPRGVWSPLTGEMRVTAGTRYTIVVSLGGADEQFEDHPFVLSTAMR